MGQSFGVARTGPEGAMRRGVAESFACGEAVLVLVRSDGNKAGRDSEWTRAMVIRGAERCYKQANT
jgi:hypothetical protein